MSKQIKNISEILEPGEPRVESPWEIKVVQSEDCMSYVVWNAKSQEGLIIDPKLEDQKAYEEIVNGLKSVRWVGVIDTHTHADHISCAATLAQEFDIPLIMHQLSPSKKVTMRVCNLTKLNLQGGTLIIAPTPGHTPDSLTVFWGPFLFGGDTILFGDVGRDDLPGGDPTAHFESLELIKKIVKSNTIVLPGHDSKGRASSWETQLKVNSSLTQGRQSYIDESTAFDAPAPKLLKKSLRENFK